VVIQVVGFSRLKWLVFQLTKTPEQSDPNEKQISQLLYGLQLYSFLEIPLETLLTVRIKHGGIAKRQLVSAQNYLIKHFDLVSEENEIEVEVTEPLANIKENLCPLVKKIAEPLFLLFNFHEFNDIVYPRIVDVSFFL